jgi:hypothetical protein
MVTRPAAREKPDCPAVPAGQGGWEANVWRLTSANNRSGRSPAHFHTNAENLTVLFGRFLPGHGAREDREAVKAYVPGDFLYIPGGKPHYGRVEGATVIQLHGTGPFDVNLAQPGGGTRR